MFKQEIVLSVSLFDSMQFRILNVYLSSDNQLIVVSKISMDLGDGGFGDYYTASEKITIDVPSNDLPIKHYLLYPSAEAVPETETDFIIIPFDDPLMSHKVVGQDAIPVHERAQCLYTNEYTEEKELAAHERFCKLDEERFNKLEQPVDDTKRNDPQESGLLIQENQEQSVKLEQPIEEKRDTRHSYSMGNAIILASVGVFAAGAYCAAHWVADNSFKP